MKFLNRRLVEKAQILDILMEKETSLKLFQPKRVKNKLKLDDLWNLT